MGAGAFVRAVAGQWPQTAAMGGALGPLELTAITVGIVGVGLLLTWSFYGAGKLPWVGPAALARGGWVERHAVQGVAGWILWGGRLLFVWVEALAADLALGTGVQAGVKGLGRWLDRGQRRFEKKGPWIAVCGVGMLLGSLFWMRG